LLAGVGVDTAVAAVIRNGPIVKRDRLLLVTGVVNMLCCCVVVQG